MTIKTQNKSQTYSLHKITSQNNIPFKASDYSKFKYGDKQIAKSFGFALAKGFIDDYLSYQPITNQIVICSSPYAFIPTATFAMKDYFIQKLNIYLSENNFNVVQECKIHRTVTYKDDYGGLSAEERMALIKNDHFHIDKSFVDGKTVIFMDDIKITGSHERVIQRMVDEFDLKCNIIYMYFAELSNPHINPNIENELNYCFVKNLLDLDKVIKNENFILNTRVVKFILNSPKDEFETFIQYQSTKLVQNIYHQAIGNGYHMIEDYSRNLRYIGKLLKTNI